MTRRSSSLAGLLLLLLAIQPLPVQGEAAWTELGIPAGGRIMLVGGLSPGQAMIGLTFPAGTATLPGTPLIPLLAPRTWIGTTGLAGKDGDLRRDLELLGWSLETHCDRDGAGLILGGPVAGLAAVTERLLGRLEAVENAPARLDLAWREQERAWQAAGESPEMALRSGLAALHHGKRPYAVGLGLDRIKPEGATPPDAEAMAAFLDERYQAGGMVMLVAGDLEPEAFLKRWRGRLERLPGRLLPPPIVPSAMDAGGGELRLAAGDRPLLILQYPGPQGAEESSGAAAALAGVLTQRMQEDIRGAGLARGASAWFDFTSPGHSPLEIQVRGFDPARLDELRTQLGRVFKRMREGEFSEYAVITAKDNLFQAMDAASSPDGKPHNDDGEALRRWGRTVLRHALHFGRWRSLFERRLLDTGKPEVQAAAQRLLVDERATLGLLDPGGER
jgi:hypothetical protein